MPALEKTFLEQPYCSKELLKDAKEVTYAEVQSSSSQRVPLAGSPLPTHMRDGCWAHPCPGSPPITTAGQGSLNCHKLTKSGVFFLNLPPTCAPHVVTVWAVLHSWVVLSHSLCPDLYSQSKAPRCSTLKEHPLHRPLLESAAVHSKFCQLMWSFVLV